MFNWARVCAGQMLPINSIVAYAMAVAEPASDREYSCHSLDECMEYEWNIREKENAYIENKKGLFDCCGI